jgi:hypothetical protein
MGKTKAEPKQELSNEEKQLLYDVIEFYIEHKLKVDRNDVRTYVMYAEILGEIAQVGDKYTDNVRFYQIKSRIYDLIDKQIEDLRKLCRRIIAN